FDGPILRQMPDEPAVVELPHRLAPQASGHGRHVGDMRAIAHRRHGGVDIVRDARGRAMHVEQRAGTLRAGPRGICHRVLSLYLRAATFFSTTSQIMAAMSGPPNSFTWRMPVGEVTLISVR